MDVSFIIVNWNTHKLLLDCLASIYNTVAELDFEVWLVDNASEDESVAAVQKAFPQVNIIENSTNRGFAAANNQALERMNGKYALLLNTDAALTTGAVDELFSFMESTPEAAMACAQLLNADGSRQNSVANFPSLITLLLNETVLGLISPTRYPHKRKIYTEPLKVDSCIGASLMVRAQAMDNVGRLDEDYFFFFEETDWAWRMNKAGWTCWLVPSARTHHYQGQSVGHGSQSRKLFYSSRYIFFKKHQPQLHGLYSTIIFGRLLVNTLLTLLVFLGTIGLEPSLRRRLAVYLELIGWHMKGCPFAK